MLRITLFEPGFGRDYSNDHLIAAPEWAIPPTSGVKQMIDHVPGFWDRILAELIARAQAHIEKALLGPTPSSYDQRSLDAKVVTLTQTMDASENVIEWVRAYRARHGHDPRIKDVQAAFDLSQTTAWRRIKNS